MGILLVLIWSVPIVGLLNIVTSYILKLIFLYAADIEMPYKKVYMMSLIIYIITFVLFTPIRVFQSVSGKHPIMFSLVYLVVASFPRFFIFRHSLSEYSRTRVSVGRVLKVLVYEVLIIIGIIYFFVILI